MFCCGSNTKNARPASAPAEGALTSPSVTTPKNLADVMSQVEGDLVPLDEFEKMSAAFLKRKEWATGRAEDIERLRQDFELLSQQLLTQNQRIGTGFWIMNLLNEKIE